MPAPRAILSGRAGVLVPRPGRLRGGSGDGQAQGEGGALPVPGLEGRGAAVALEDRADERQAEPGPLDAARLAGEIGRASCRVRGQMLKSSVYITNVAS